MRKFFDFARLKEQRLPNILVSILLFLYPLAGVSVRNWFSGFAVLIVLIGLYLIFQVFKNNNNLNLDRDEKYLIFSVSMLFISYLASGFANGWNDNQLDYFLGELNFLFFIPLYIAIRNIEKAPEYIIKGSIISGILFIIPYIYESDFSKYFLGSVEGIYSHLFTGPVAIIMAFIMLGVLKRFLVIKYWNIVIILSILNSFNFAIATRSGTAYSLAILMFLIMPLIVVRKMKSRILVYAGIMILLTVAFAFNEDVHDGVLRVTNSAEKFISIKDIASYDGNLGTAGERMAMWMASWTVFKDHILFGVGRGNYNHAVKKYFAQGLVNKVVILHSHPHNIYFETLSSKGLFGIAVFFVLMALILKKYYVAWKNNVVYSISGLLHITAILIVGLGISGPLIKNNFTSIFLVYTAVFYSYFNGQLKQKNTS